MNILLIPGHGEKDSGAVAGKYCEKELTRELSRNLQNELLKYICNCDVYDEKLSAYHQMIVDKKHFDFTPYNYVLELHFNAYVANEDGKVKGSEIYITTSEKTTSLEKRILKKLQDLGFTNRGVKRKNFAVISKARAQGVSSALLELCFIDDTDDMRLYENNKNKVAEIIARAIAEEFNLKSRDYPTFPDVKNHWAERDILNMAKYGHLMGYPDGTFKPERAVTRAELATVMGRLFGI